MAENRGESIRKAFEDVLKKFDINLESTSVSEEIEKLERHGDYAEIISKTQERIDELNDRAETLLSQKGMTREQLEAYVSNPDNFNSEQWKALEKLKKETEEFKKNSQKVFKEEGRKPTKGKGKKKKASRLSKKKDWIPL